MQKNSVNVEDGGLLSTINQNKRRFTIGSVRDFGRQTRRKSTSSGVAPTPGTLERGEVNNSENSSTTSSHHVGSNFSSQPNSGTNSTKQSPRSGMVMKPFVRAEVVANDQSLNLYDDRRRTSSFGGMTPRESAIVAIRNARLAAALNRAEIGALSTSSSMNTNPVLTNNNHVNYLHKRRASNPSVSNTSKGNLKHEALSNMSQLTQSLPPEAAEDMWNKQFQNLFDSVTPTYCRLSTINEQPSQNGGEDSSASTHQQTAPQQTSLMPPLPEDRVVSPIIGPAPPTVVSESSQLTMVESVSCSEEFRKTFAELFPTDTASKGISDECIDVIAKETPRHHSRRAGRRSSQVHFAPTRYP